jgi:hypothetical protein
MARRRIGFDRSAYAFAVAARLATSTRIRAINALTIGTKFDGIWPLIQCLYPFVGSTAASHSLNLRNPAQYPITWSGTLSHTTIGVVSAAGGDGVGVTDFVQTLSECYLGLYVNQSTGPQTAQDWGVYIEGNGSHLHYQFADGRAYLDIGHISVSRLSANVGSTGYVGGGAIGGSMFLARNATVIGTRVATTTAPLSNGYRLFRADPGGGGYLAPSRTYATAVASHALTPAQHTLLYGRIQAFQIALGRAIAP